MSIRVRMNHVTRYDYSMPVFLAPQLVRLRPAPHCRTQITRYSLNIEPSQHALYWQQDPFNNYIARLLFSEATQLLSINVEIEAIIAPINPYDFYVENYAAQWPFIYEPTLKTDLASYLYPENHGNEMSAFVDELASIQSSTLDFLTMLNKKISESIRYEERLQSGVQTCDTTLQRSSGSCRDSAWLLVQVFRSMGLAARFVSGYSIQLVGSTTNQSSQTDSTDLHAWAEVFIPGAGWIGLDPSAGTFAREGYIPLCCTREPASAAPVSGLTSQADARLSFENKVIRLND